MNASPRTRNARNAVDIAIIHAEHPHVVGTDRKVVTMSFTITASVDFEFDFGSMSDPILATIWVQKGFKLGAEVDLNSRCGFKTSSETIWRPLGVDLDIVFHAEMQSNFI